MKAKWPIRKAECANGHFFFLRDHALRLAAAILLCLSVTAAGQRPHSAPPPQHPAPAPHYSAAPRPNPQPKAGQQHLGEWLQRNQGLSPQEQRRALEREPGFSRLPPQQQQRLSNRLDQLNGMPPSQRERTVERIENMERLSPQKKQEVRSSAQSLAQMPADRQQAMKKAIRDLRDVPTGLRQSELNSPRYTSQFSPDERNVLGNLLSVEPYHPQPPPPR